METINTDVNLNLALSAEKGDWRGVCIAIDKGANKWEYALAYASRGNQLDLVKFFINKLKGHINWNFIITLAAEGGNLSIIMFIVNWLEQNPEYTHLVKEGSSLWYSGVSGALRGNHLHLAQFFINKGANLEVIQDIFDIKNVHLFDADF